MTPVSLSTLPHEIFNKIEHQIAEKELHSAVRVSKEWNSFIISYAKTSAQNNLNNIGQLCGITNDTRISLQDLKIDWEASKAKGLIDVIFEIATKIDDIVAHLQTRCSTIGVKKLKKQIEQGEKPKLCEKVFFVDHIKRCENHYLYNDEVLRLLMAGDIDAAIHANNLMYNWQISYRIESHGKHYLDLVDTIVKFLANAFYRTEKQKFEETGIEYAKCEDKRMSRYAPHQESFLMPFLEVFVKKRNTKKAITLAEEIVPPLFRDRAFGLICRQEAAYSIIEAYPILDMIKDPQIRKIAFDNITYSSIQKAKQ